MSDATWRDRFRHLRLGSIVFDDGRVVPLDWRDLMWASRAMLGENGRYGSATIETDATMWAMVNRLRLLADQPFGRGEAYHEPPHRLFHMLLAYCQPINPYWRTRGDAAARARRARFAVMAPDDPRMNPAGIARVVALLRGQISRMPYMRIVDFAQCHTEGVGIDVHGPPDLVIDGCFWSGPGGRTLNERSVYIAPPRGPHARIALAGAALAVGAGGVLVLAR